MFSRSLITLGLCAVFGFATPAFADIAKPQKPTTVSAKSKQTANAAASTKARKKIAGKAVSGSKKLAKADDQVLTDKDKAKAKLATVEKARQAKLLALRAKAKADANARREAAKAPAADAKSAKLAKAETPEDKTPIEVGFKPITAKAIKAPTAERIAAQQAAAVGADVVVQKGNNGELRSEVAPRQSGGFFDILFGDEPSQVSSMLPETRALDSVLEQRDAKKKFRVKPQFEPQSVAFSGYSRGTIVIDTDAHFLYLVESGSSARRYGIAVGRDGLQFKGQVAVGDKQEWPRWIPTLDMQKREPKKYGRYKDGMPGGGQNPLGARAIYLYEGKHDTHLRIHGTIAPQSIGTNASNGCFRMINEHVIDLYSRVRPGTPVVIL